VKGRKRHLLVDTEGFVLRAKVHSAKVMDYVKASRSYWIVRRSSSHASLTFGWTEATREKTRARTGYREGVRVERRDRQQAAQAGPRGSADEVGQGMDQRGREGRLAEAHATAGFRRLATSVGRGEDVFLALSEQEDEQRLRETNRHKRGDHIRGHDPCDGEAFSPCSVVFGQFLHALR
jgi:hypothetical protein